MSPIHHTFGPHIDARYLRSALGVLFTPWRWKSGTAARELEQALARQLGMEAVTFASGRQALLALLEAMGIKKEDEIIVQAYTCVVVPNAIHAAGGTVVYADIEKDTLNLNLDDTERKITSKTRAIICQHTFGIPADTAALRALCDKHKLLLIEDCAHIIPDDKGPAEIGKHGDAMLLSFGRDKAVSGVAGGAMLVRDPGLATKLKEIQRHLKPVPLPHIFAYVCYPLAYAVARPLYAIGIGKALLVALREIGLLLPIVRQEEKKGHQPLVLELMPNACALLALRHLARLPELNDHRRRLTSYYFDQSLLKGWPLLGAIGSSLPLQKFPMFLYGSEKLRKQLRTKGIHLDDGWTGCVICPADADWSAAGYKEGTDPMAEEACERILSLPTHPTMTKTQAEYLVERLDELLKQGK